MKKTTLHIKAELCHYLEEKLKVSSNWEIYWIITSQFPCELVIIIAPI